MVITIDGPTASGKSSIAKRLAARLGMHCLNTGLLYRAVAYLLTQCYGDVVLSVQGGVFAMHDQDLHLIDDLRYAYDQGKPQVFYQEQDITDNLFNDQISQLSSMVSACGKLRKRLLPIQRDVAKHYNVIADGRDCGSVVFPDADFKFYLTASTLVRAQRRFVDFKKPGLVMDLAQVIKSIEERDQRDSNRAVAPLMIPQGAVVIDNSGMAVEQTVEAFLAVIKK